MGKGKGKGTPRRNRQQPKRRTVNGGQAAMAKNRKYVDAVTHGQTRNILQEYFRRGETQGFSRSLMATMWVLHEHYGYGAKRLEPFLAELTEFCNEYLLPNTKSIRRGEFHGLSVEELRDEMFEVYGFYINLESGTVFRVDEKPYDLDELPPEALKEMGPVNLEEDFWVSTTPEVRNMIIREALDNNTTPENILEYKIHQLYTGGEAIGK